MIFLEELIYSLNNFIWGFYQRDLYSARLKYINTEMGSEETNFDTFTVKILITFYPLFNDKQQSFQHLIGPLKIQFKIIEKNQV